MKNKFIKFSLWFILIILASIGISYLCVTTLLNNQEETIAKKEISAIENNKMASISNYNIDLIKGVSSSEKQNTIDGTVYAPTQWVFQHVESESGHPWLIPWNKNFQIYCIEIGGNVYCYDGQDGCTKYSTMKSYIGNNTYKACAFTSHASNPRGYAAVSRTMWKSVETGILPAVTAYIVSYSDSWTPDKQYAIWNNIDYEEGLVSFDKNSLNQGHSRLDQESIDYSKHDDKVRKDGINPANKTDINSVLTKVDQQTQQYTVGPFKMTYNECIYGNVAFGGISKMTVVGYDRNNNVVNSNILFKISLENGATGAYSSPKAPQYFTPNTSDEDYGVDRSTQYYPASGQNFQIVLNDPNKNITDENKKVVSISVKVEFKYMLANGAYNKLEGVRYGMKMTETHVSNGTAHQHFNYTNWKCGGKPLNANWEHYGHSLTEDCPDGSKCGPTTHRHSKGNCAYEDVYYTCTDCTKKITGIEVKYSGQDIMAANADRTIYTDELTLSSKIQTSMDLGGYVWEDALVGKENKADGLNNTTGDKAIQNIRVILYDKNNKYIAEKRTDSDGYYLFTNLDPMKKYYVAFEYNGQLYIPTEYKKTNNWKNTSKATETSTDRTAFDNRFAEIGAYPNNYKRSNGKYNKAYSQYELMGFKLDANGKYYYDKSQHYIDTFYTIDKNGNIIEGNKINPAQVSSGDAQKVNFVNDTKIVAYTQAQKAGLKPDLYPMYDQFVINKTADQTYATGKQARETKFNTNSVKYAGKEYKAIYPDQFFIDLGLVRRQEVDLALRKDILYAATKINSKTEIYQYDKRANNENYWQIQYRMRNYTDYYGGMYVNGIYRSDYTYRGEKTNGGSDLEAYVTYKITVRNSSIDVLGKITEVVDYYDKDYTYMPNLSWAMYKDKSTDNNTKISLKKEDYYNMIESNNLSKIPNTRKITTKTSSKYGAKSDITTKMNAIYISGLENKTLAVGEQAYIYLTFKVNKDGDNPITVDKDNEFKMNYAEINGYKTYYTGNTELPNGVKKTSKDAIGLIDINSTPGNLILANITGDKYEKNFENDTDRAKGLQIKIDDNAQRKISGTVWEDQRTQVVSGTSVGDGVRQTNEIKIQGVTVQLLEKLKDGKEFLWRTTTTDANGAYTFSEFIPGNYIVRFMYGHNLPTVQTKNNVSYNGHDFKSTVYQKEINGKEISGYAEKYYNIRAADTFGKNLSDARDIWEDKTISIGQRINNRPTAVYQNVTLQGRETVNKYLANGAKNHDAEILAVPYASNPNQTYIAELIKNTQMVAETGIIVIEGEYDRQTTLGDSTQKTSNGKENYANGNDVNGTYEIKNLDFGLIERPKAQLELNKQVKNVKITLANGNILFDADDAVANLAWIKHKDYDLLNKMKDGKYEDYYKKSKQDKKYNRYSYKTDLLNLINKTLYKGGKNGLIQITMDSELMHGATIQITYDLTIRNVGEVDYTGKDFYYKATGATEANKVTTTANLLVDYVANNLQYREADNEDWTVVKAQDLITTGNVNGSLATSLNKYNTIIVTNKINKALKPGETVNKELILTQTITAQNTQDNMTYENVAEILQTSNTVGRRMAFSIVGNQDPTKALTEVDSAKAENIVILPPFGQIYLYFGLGILTLAVIAGGVIFIKKKVLKK